ncbi:MAG: peptidoglycan-binding protein [Scytonema sp. PMC 1069.18]|nr:peptidoglycan-binding protein [Scytonema sp. PMC 1069.18]MEC4887529.1 peptidoglycan-binding protein [Scytonema sp. PMC 1070.18]
MENLAYLHVASVYEDLPSSEIVSLSRLFKQAKAPNWRKLSGKAWKYMLPVAIILSVLSSFSYALALEKGDRGPSVRNLQNQLKRAGFYQAPVTQVYDLSTEEAVRRFQRSAGLDATGIAGYITLQKLDGWEISSTNSPTQTPSSQSTQAKKPNSTSSKTEKVAAANSNVTKRRNPNLLQKGDEGEAVRILQERLRVAGYYYGNATGIYGPITEEAVQRFQKAYDLDVDGIAGPATLAKLPAIGIGYGDDTPVQKVKAGDRLQLGDRGEAVRLLQEQLIQANYLKGEPNGVFGPFTAEAVKRFQASNYLAVSGIAGPTTRGKLYEAIATAPRSDFNVLEIQRRLFARGFYKGDLNGVMGDDTKKAIKQAQEFYGISLNDVKSGRF